jgi:hypothetical protein
MEIINKLQRVFYIEFEVNLPNGIGVDTRSETDTRTDMTST